MSTVKISQLPAATVPLAGTELLPIVQNDVTKKVAVSAVGSAVNVKSYGAVGDGITNDAAAISLAITAAGENGTVFFPKGTYLVAATLQMLSGQAFVGEGGTMQGTSTIKKGANGDLINMIGLCRLENLNLDSVGGTYTGRGIYVSDGFSQVINNVRSTNNVTYALEFQATSGSGAFVTNFVADMITASADTAAIKVGENYPTNVVRFFQNIWLSNGKFDLTNTVAFTLDGFFCRGFITGPSYVECAVNKISNGRVSTPGTPLVLSMGDSSMTNVPVSGTTNLTKCQGIMLANCQFDTLTIDNTSTNPAVGGVTAAFVAHRQQNYTCVWNQASGIQPSIGDGSITSTVTYNGYLVHVYIRVVMGSTTTFGNGATAWQFSLPRIATGVHNQYIPAAYIKMNSGNYIYLGQIAIGAGEQVLTISYQNQLVRLGWPFTWASGDTIEMSFDYLPP
jgi:hypothetical protein